MKNVLLERSIWQNYASLIGYDLWIWPYPYDLTMWFPWGLQAISYLGRIVGCLLKVVHDHSYQMLENMPITTSHKLPPLPIPLQRINLIVYLQLWAFLDRSPFYVFFELYECNWILLPFATYRGLMCIHRMKIVHRDLKSANCLVNKHWTVKICDFGLSRIMTESPMKDSSSAGTPEWMAPELIRNEPFSEKCDIFSLGVIMWELCTLTRPWEGVPPDRVFFTLLS